jgi:hypothetical protein
LPDPAPTSDFVHTRNVPAVRWKRREFEEMAKQKHADPKLDVIEMRTALARRIAARAPSPGEHATAVCGLSLFRRTTPTACYRGAYEPSLNVFVQGRKLINLGGTEYLCDGSSFLLSSIDVPVQSQIVEASEEVPLLSMLLRLDMPIVREVLSRQDLPEPEASSQRRGIAVGETTAGLLGACARLIEILETPEDVPFLSPLIQREIVYRILRTPQGERLRAIANGRSEPQNCESDHLAQGQLYKAAPHGGTRGGGTNGRVDAPPSVPRLDCNEPAPIPEAA